MGGILARPLAAAPPRLLEDQMPVHERDQRLQSVFGKPPQRGIVAVVLQAEIPEL
ncbi:hypothetical protein ACLQ28_34070 [Micromonospora sp. DT201]|uniref:hypothetical protein n=1 Tax=Micromonospora sp. DT201 TaxID=3393442 RepID=UPI003CF3AF6A